MAGDEEDQTVLSASSVEQGVARRAAPCGDFDDGVVRLKAVEYLADKRAIKDRFIQFGPIRNETDGRTVVIPASSAGKIRGVR